MKKFRFISGTILILLGFLITLSSYNKITGNAILSSNSGIIPKLIIGIVIWISGIFLLTSARTSVSTKEKTGLEIIVVDTSNGDAKTDSARDAAYAIQDPRAEMGSAYLRLGEFKKRLGDFRKDPEMFSAIKEVYVPQLEHYARDGDIHTKQAARAFLEVFGVEVKDKPEEIRLTSEQRDEIGKAFREWDGKMTSQRENILERYGLEVDRGEKSHYKITNPRGGQVSLGSTPSDYRAGLNNVSRIVGLIEGRYAVKPKKKD